MYLIAPSLSSLLFLLPYLRYKYVCDLSPITTSPLQSAKMCSTLNLDGFILSLNYDLFRLFTIPVWSEIKSSHHFFFTVIVLLWIKYNHLIIWLHIKVITKQYCVFLFDIILWNTAFPACWTTLCDQGIPLAWEETLSNSELIFKDFVFCWNLLFSVRIPPFNIL